MVVLLHKEAYARIIAEQMQGVRWPTGLPVRLDAPYAWYHGKIGYVLKASSLGKYILLRVGNKHRLSVPVDRIHVAEFQLYQPKEGP